MWRAGHGFPILSADRSPFLRVLPHLSADSSSIAWPLVKLETHLGSPKPTLSGKQKAKPCFQAQSHRQESQEGVTPWFAHLLLWSGQRGPLGGKADHTPTPWKGPPSRLFLSSSVLHGHGWIKASQWHGQNWVLVPSEQGDGAVPSLRRTGKGELQGYRRTEGQIRAQQLEHTVGFFIIRSLLPLARAYWACRQSSSLWSLPFMGQINLTLPGV